MKKLLFFLLLAAFFGLTGCKKDTTDPEGYFLKLKINANEVTWKSVLTELGPDLADNTKYNFGLTGTSPDTKQTFSLDFQVKSGTITTGSYSSRNYFMPVDYIDESNGMKWFSMQENKEPYSVYTITISSITETAIKGTFEGNFLVNDLDETEKAAITEGSFSARRIR